MVLPMFLSCGSQSVYEEFKSFENMSWNRFDDQQFEFRVKDIGSKYTLKIILVPDTNIQNNTIAFDTRIITPGGEERLMSHKLHLNRQKPDEASSDEGKQAFSAYLLKDHTFSEKGPVKIDVYNRMPITRTTGLHEIGLKVLKK